MMLIIAFMLGVITQLYFDWIGKMIKLFNKYLAIYRKDEREKKGE